MCIVIAVFNGIKISHKLFTPEMVVPALSICDTTSGTPVNAECGLQNAENRERVKCRMLHAEKYCGTKGKMWM